MYRGSFRTQTTRMKNWNYASDAVYFVTICTHGRSAWFGDVVDAAIDHTTLGLVASHLWLEIPMHFQNVQCDEFIVMPDHIHGILKFDLPSSVETRHGASLRINQFGSLQQHSLSLVINMYKGAVTRWCRRNAMEDFRWQSRFHERHIRSTSELRRVRTYVRNNPIHHSLFDDA
ncbi:transposase [Candidatus Peribacteria bacterium]|nr:transposase [Candidatus Peribacteria bacterium]